MEENKLIKMAIMFIGEGEVARYKVTNKLKNYPTEMRDEAVKALIDGAYVQIFQGKGKTIGRTPAFIKLTEKGLEKLKGYSDKPTHKSVWNI